MGRPAHRRALDAVLTLVTERGRVHTTHAGSDGADEAEVRIVKRAGPLRRWRRRRGDDSGVAMIEFALVLPLLAMVVFGIVDLSRAYELQNRLRNSAREGAAFAQYFPGQRLASCNTGRGDSIQEKATNEDDGVSSLRGFDVKAFRIRSGTTTEYTTCQPNTSFLAGDQVRVEVSADYDVLTPLIGVITGRTNYTLTGKSEVRVQK